MKRRIVLCLLALALLLVTGCTQEKEAEPLTVTLWHVYGGEVDSPLNGLIERFNSTVGAKQNIRVKVELVSNSGSIHKSVLAAANSDPGAPSLPDMFVSYPKTVLALPDQSILVDYRDYFSEEELAAFIPAFREEGMIGGRQADAALAAVPEGANAVALRVKNARGGRLRAGRAVRRRYRQMLLCPRLPLQLFSGGRGVSGRGLFSE